ncbi:MAG: phage late control D family protein [Campylobacteraceae bacterium]
MVKYPAFKLIAEGKDITDVISKNLISLAFEDKEGIESDEISFVVHGIYQKPLFGDKLQLSLGYAHELYECGIFSTQNITINYIEKTTEVRATAVNFASPQKETKSRLWENTTLGEVARTIAKDNKLSISIDDTADEIQISSTAQNNQNDISFLYSLCFKNNFLMFVKKDTIFIKHKDAIENKELVKTSDLPVYNININELLSLSITDANRNSYDAVTLEWQDTATAKTKIVKVGIGEQIYKMRTPEPKSEAEAFKQGESKLYELQRGGINGTLEAIGQNIKAGEKLKISTIDKEFSIKSVSHNLDDTGYIVTVDFEG